MSWPNSTLLKRLKFAAAVALVVGVASIVVWLVAQRADNRNSLYLFNAETTANAQSLESYFRQTAQRLGHIQKVAAEDPLMLVASPLHHARIAAGPMPGLVQVAWVPVAGDTHAWQTDDVGGPQVPAETFLADARRAAIRADFVGPELYFYGGQAESDPAFIGLVLAWAPAGQNGAIAVLLDAEAVFEDWLVHTSPWVALRIVHDERVLFTRGELDASVPEQWQRQVPIRLPGGAQLVLHQAPLPATTRLMTAPATSMLPLLGLVISVLMGTLAYENARARHRAKSAERAEQELDRMNRDLERLVEERTVDLRTVSDSVAHDLRNPLNAIAANVELVRYRFREGLGREGDEILQRIPRSIGQITAILDRLLGLSTLSHAEFERQPVDLRSLAREVFNELIVAEPPPPVDLELGPLGEVQADPLMTRLLLMNLLNNAIKYTRDQSQRTITVSCEDQDGETVYCVRDNGQGFEEESARRLFEAFQRLGQSKSVEGFGLGLTIAARVVHRHGGRIWAKGERGSGAAFFFTLAPPPDGGAPPTGEAS